MARPRTSKPLGDDCRKCHTDDWLIRPSGIRVCAECARRRTNGWHKKNAAWALLISARGRARKAGVPCTITPADITIGRMCPVLKVPMVKGTRYAPSLDRIDPSLGYVPGNIVVMSRRANEIKSDASGEEVLKVAHWIQRMTRNARRA